MICVYHSKDLDGYCSAAIVKKRYPGARLIGYDYGDPIPVTPQDLRGEDLILVDVSFPMDVMNELAIFPRSFVWIDHHATAIGEFQQKQLGDLIVPYVQVGIAACELAWGYLFPDDPMPLAVRMLGAYDTWRQDDLREWEMRTLPFQYGMRMECQSPETFPQELLYTTTFALAKANDIILNGLTILAYQKQQNERACRSAFAIDFEGYKAVCLNAGGGNSTIFDSVYDPDKHDLMIAFFFSGKRWTFSLYTTHDIDCGALAKKMGGGGHAKAAGFHLSALPLAFQVHVPWPVIEKEGAWKVKMHHYATGGDDYDGYNEITNGKISIYTKEISEEEGELEAVARALQAAQCDFYLDDSAAFCLHHLEGEYKKLEAERAVYRQALEQYASTEMNAIADEALKKYPTI